MTIFDSIRYPIPNVGDKGNIEWVYRIPMHFKWIYATHPERKFMNLEQRRKLLRKIILEYEDDNI